jgi:hypothetical protein
VVLLFARAVSPIPAAVGDLVPADTGPSITVEQTCQSTGGRAIVRTLPDGSIEGVTCG